MTSAADIGHVNQVWITGPGEISVRRVPEPAAGPGEVVVETAFAGICGSDLHTFKRGHPWLGYPIAPGHEAAGVIAAVGDGVDGLQPGDRVYLQPAVSCGDCFYCLRGRPNLCDRLIGVGSHVGGAFCDRFVVPAAAVRPIPPDLSFAAAAMIEPFATVAHAIRLAGGVDGATVAVLGAGSIGQAVLLSVLASGARAAVITDPVPDKRDRGVSLGAIAGIDPGQAGLRDAVSEHLGGRPDITFDCVASAVTLRSAVDLAVKGGSVVVVGVGHGPVEFEIEALQDQEVSVIGSAMYHPADFDRAEELVREVRGERLVTAVLPIDEAPDALARAAQGHETKIHLSGPCAS
jgi:L-iditol 2-dehydrogenase